MVVVVLVLEVVALIWWCGCVSGWPSQVDCETGIAGFKSCKPKGINVDVVLWWCGSVVVVVLVLVVVALIW